MRHPSGSYPLLSLNGLSIGYGDSQPLLEGINLTLNSGELVALIGANGSGKSTLIRSLVGLLPPLKGECLLEGTPVRSIGLRNRARKVSYVSARPGPLPSITVSELVGLGRLPYTGWSGRLSGEDLELVRRAIGAVKLEAYTGRSLEQLSDGERQRAMIARAFVQDTPLMVLDEPTAFLDLPHKYGLVRLLTGFREEGRSILYSTHDLESALMVADRLWVIHGGAISEGAPEDLGMMGVFDTLFETSGIAFDAESRRFRNQIPVRGAVRLTGGDRTVLAWTRNALERLGFAIGDQSSREVNVAASGPGYLWRVIREGKEESFADIASLAQFLIKDN